MGTSTSVGEFAGKLHAASRAIERGTYEGVREAAMTGKVIFLANMGTRNLRNVGRNGGAQVSASFSMAGGVSNPSALLRYTGPVHLLNNPTQAHAIYPRGLRIMEGDSVRTAKTTQGRRLFARAGGKQGLRFPDGNVRLYANHPGTKGKQFFQRSKPQVAAAFRSAMQRGQRQALARIF